VRAKERALRECVRERLAYLKFVSGGRKRSVPANCRDETLFEFTPCAGHRRETISVQLNCSELLLCFGSLGGLHDLGSRCLLGNALTGSLTGCLFRNALGSGLLRAYALSGFLGSLANGALLRSCLLGDRPLLGGTFFTVDFLTPFWRRTSWQWLSWQWPWFVSAPHQLAVVAQ
jgi:hypothetical protein